MDNAPQNFSPLLLFPLSPNFFYQQRSLNPIMFFSSKSRTLIPRLLLLRTAILFSVQTSQVHGSCTSGCDLAQGSYYTWAGENLTYIASLFNIPTASITDSNRANISIVPGRDILLAGIRINIPFNCDCFDNNFLARVFSYNVTSSTQTTFDTIAKVSYSNLTSAAWLKRFNSYPGNGVSVPHIGVLNVPVNCSCGGEVSNGYRYFVTWPVQDGETLESVAAANNLTADLVKRYNPTANFTAGNLLYIPMGVPNDSPTPALGSSKRQKSTWKLKLSIGVVAPFLATLTLLSLYCILQRKKVSGIGAINKLKRVEWSADGDKEDDESIFFSFSSIESATDHFSEAKRLGQGGFGPVYKGKFNNGLEVAVKRLNKMTIYGTEQFKNEVTVISKLQHRNLVKLLGYCTHGEERILVYEYLPNKSLDSFLFDTAKQDVLDWKARLKIIEGVAQGLLYLHKYSRLKIIHRDLKPSNVLLDNDMNPKISDFGTARIFGDNELRANTSRIVGTYGYMSPEYAMDGIFSEKSDVFSFGVMILEIITGKKNTAFHDSDRHLNLIGHVWDLWIEGSLSDITDSSLNEAVPKPEALKCVQVGLLCVQEKAADRPTMSEVVSMLFNESMVLASPKRPAFSEIMSLKNANLPQNPVHCSMNKVTISEVEGR
ncbi:cysteine-rich receptor-like protein kinase 15 isoform X2 [Coffea arabica]|uniref:Cysteine-rich receptor-like protein kinase 15 isoform X2 n=1 Tax=Coffea arabica TaxID=13443 RepID=A0ABM4U8D1_COFAR